MSCWNSVSQKFQAPVMYLCGVLGYHAYKHPYVFNVCGLLLTLLCGSGVINFEFENDPVKLYLPQDSDAVKQYDEFDNLFGFKPYFLFVFEEKNGENLITTDRMNAMYSNVFSKVTYQIEVDGDDANETYTFSDVCDTLGSFCNAEVSNLFGVMLGESGWQTDDDIQDSLCNDDAQGAVVLLMADEKTDPTFSYCLGTNYTGFYTGGSVVRVRWMLADFEDKDMKEIRDDFMAEVFEYYLDDGGNEDLESIDITINPASSNSLAEESGKTLSSSGLFLGGAIVLMFIFFAWMAGDVVCVRGRPWIALVDIVVIVMTLISGIGLGLSFAQELNSLALLTIFLVISISFTNQSVIIGSVDTTRVPNLFSDAIDDREKGAERFRKALKDSGLAITTTTLIKVIGFGVASATPIPAAKAFCVFTSMCLLMEFILQLLIFVPVLALDEHRKLPLQKFNAGMSNSSSPKKGQTKLDQAATKGNAKPPPLVAEQGRIQWLIQTCIINLLSTHVAQGIVIVVFLLFYGLSAYAITELKFEFDPLAGVPDDSYIVDFYKVYEDAFGTPTFPEYDIVIKNLDFSDPVVRANVSAMFTKIEEYQSEDDPTVFPVGDVWNWLEGVEGLDLPGYEEYFSLAYAPYGLDYTDRATYYQYLDAYLQATAVFAEDVIFSDGTNATLFSNETYIEATKFYIRFNKPRDFEDQWFYKRELDKIVSEFVEPNGGSGYIVTRFMPFFYFPEFIEEATLIVNVLFNIVVLIILLLFVDFRMAVFIYLNVILIDITVLGWMVGCGITLDPVGFVVLLFANGINADYLIHATHAMRVSELKTRHFGISIFRAAVATILGAVFLMASGANLLRKTYALFSGILLISLLQAIVFVPAVMGLLDCLYDATYIGPLLDYHDDKDDENINQNESKMKEKLEMAQRNSKVMIRQQTNSQSGRQSNTGSINRPYKERDDSASGGANVSDPTPQITKEDSLHSRSSNGSKKIDTQEIMDVAAEVMVLAQDYGLDRLKRRTLRRIIRKIEELGDPKLNDLALIVKQINKAKERSLEAEKVKEMFLNDLDDFIEENAQLFDINTEYSSTNENDRDVVGTAADRKQE